MISPRNDKLPSWFGQWLSLGGGGVKPVFGYSKRYTFSTLFWEENENNGFTLSTRATCNMNKMIENWKEVTRTLKEHGVLFVSGYE